MQYHVNGELRDRSTATVRVTDRGFRFGDAAHETVRVYDGVPFQWAAHVDRLLDTCETLGIDAPIGRAALTDRVRSTIDANDVRNAVVTVSITRGPHPGSALPPSAESPTVVVTLVEPDSENGDDVSGGGPATLQTVRTRRIPPECLPGIDTTHNQLNTVLACRELQTMSRESPADDALIRNLDGQVVGGALAALFVVTPDRLHSPAPAAPDAPAITRDMVREIAREEDVPVGTAPIDRDTVHGAAEVFLANTRWGIRSVETVDGIDMDEGPMTELLAARYRARIDDACEDGPWM